MPSVCLLIKRSVYISCVALLVCSHAREEDWNITVGIPVVKVLPPFGNVSLSARGLSASNLTSSVTCQVHAQVHNVTLSMSAHPGVSTSVNGHDVGVITVLRIGQTEARWFLMSQHNFSLSVVVAVTELTDQNPLPGGCNIEFNLENDANIHLRYTDYLNVLTFQWSALSFRRDQEHPLDCVSRSDQFSLTYDIYVYYLPGNDILEDTYIHAVQQMLTVDSVKQIGQKIASLTYNDKSNISVVSYPGHGVIYTVLVTQTGKGSSLYFPVSTYSCSLNSSGCEQALKADVAGIVLTTIASFVGIFICFFGHRFFKTEMFIFGFLSMALVTYIGLIPGELGLAEHLLVAGAVGVLGGLAWLIFWWFLGIPVLSVLLVGLVAGYVFSSLVFFTPFGDLKYWHNRFNFGMTFSCGVLILPVLLLCFTRILNILSCAFVGSFSVILAAGMYLHSEIKYILLSQFNRFFLPEYNSAIHTVPFQLNEIILSTLWAVLFISGTIFQYVRERKRPPFPPCPRSKIRARTLYRQQKQDESDERRPLLRDSQHRPPSYGRIRVMSFPRAESDDSRQPDQNTGPEHSLS
ncbi:transmembrane 7 superfamily member 3-like [Liolophura sinensis]|uniref:transmembrane 7 superfamily member 3-like n=1 Tax=Liolophura sinensis TaxID=3198878 RepID=UPI0031587342